MANYLVFRLNGVRIESKPVINGCVFIRNLGTMDVEADLELSLWVGDLLNQTPTQHTVGFWSDTDADGIPDTELNSVTGTPPTDAWEEISVTAEAVPVGTEVFVRLSVPDSGGTVYQNLFDDLELTVIPEPSSIILALIGVTVMAILSRRWR